jgi:hypothetical protein
MRYWLAQLRVWLAMSLLDKPTRGWLIQTVGRSAYKSQPPERLPIESMMAGILFMRYVQSKNKEGIDE